MAFLFSLNLLQAGIFPTNASNDFDVRRKLATCSCQEQNSAAYYCSPEEASLGLTPGMYEGESISFLSVLSASKFPAFGDTAFRLKNCTGLTVIIADAPGLNALQPAVQQDLGLGLTNGGASIYDAYMVRSNWLPPLMDSDLVESLNTNIQGTPGMNWADILPAVKTLSTVQQNGSAHVGMLPIDADYWMVVQREDLRVQYGRVTPTTMEELVTEAEFFHGKDLNSDGQSDYGICVNLLTYQPWIASVLYFIVAPYLQTLPSSGLFFSTTTMAPQVDNPGWREAVNLTKRLHAVGKMAANFHPNYGKGRCAFLLTLPGLTKKYTLSPVATTNSSGHVIWSAGTGHSRMLSSLGSLKVVTAAGELRVCDGTKAVCPREVLSSRGQYINVAPFFVAGSWGMAIRATASSLNKQLAWVFLSHVSIHAVQRISQAGQFMDAFRDSHFTDSLYLSRGWMQSDVSNAHKS